MTACNLSSLSPLVPLQVKLADRDLGSLKLEGLPACRLRGEACGPARSSNLVADLRSDFGCLCGDVSRFRAQSSDLRSVILFHSKRKEQNNKLLRH